MHQMFSVLLHFDFDISFKDSQLLVTHIFQEYITSTGVILSCKMWKQTDLWILFVHVYQCYEYLFPSYHQTSHIRFRTWVANKIVDHSDEFGRGIISQNIPVMLYSEVKSCHHIYHIELHQLDDRVFTERRNIQLQFA